MKLIQLLRINSSDLKTSFYIEFVPFYPLVICLPVVNSLPDRLYQVYLTIRRLEIWI